LKYKGENNLSCTSREAGGMSKTRIICPNGCGFPIAFCKCEKITELTESINAYIEYAEKTKKFSDVAFYERVKARIRQLEEAISEHKEIITGTDVKPMGVDHILWDNLK
jgi:hypothetical protein